MTAALQHPIGPTTVTDWLAADHRPYGSRLELVWGHLYMTSPPSMGHQYAGLKLARVIDEALCDRPDLYVVPAIGARISTALRTALIPDIAVINIPPVGTSCAAEYLVLVVEIWSPDNNRSERDTKAAAYAAAGVRYYWTLDADRTLTAHRLVGGQYVVDTVAKPGTETAITAAPAPVTFDPARLRP
ncbi:MAG: Uma2 family endonuclease [Sciscionella sp.]